MKIQEFLEHHGIEGNPFAEEDAQNDTVFKRTCLESTFHPGWDKIYGSPEDPSTSIVFGEKGAAPNLREWAIIGEKFRILVPGANLG